MKAALVRYAAGEQAKVPPWFVVHVIAARYGTTPEAVREWPADDFAHAVAAEPFMGPRGGRRG